MFSRLKRNRATNPQILLQTAHKAIQKKQWHKAIDALTTLIELDDTHHEGLKLADSVFSQTDYVWRESDFVNHVHITMKLQELNNPTYKRIHARLEPKYKMIAQHIQKLLNASADDEQAVIEEILAHGAFALYPLIDVITALKKSNRKKKCEDTSS